MTTLATKATIGADGRLRVDVATSLPAGEVDVQVILPDTTDPRAPKPRRFDDLVGKLSYQGDPMAIQRELRNEWPE